MSVSKLAALSICAALAVVLPACGDDERPEGHWRLLSVGHDQFDLVTDGEGYVAWVGGPVAMRSSAIFDDAGREVRRISCPLIRMHRGEGICAGGLVRVPVVEGRDGYVSGFVDVRTGERHRYPDFDWVEVLGSRWLVAARATGSYVPTGEVLHEHVFVDRDTGDAVRCGTPCGGTFDPSGVFPYGPPVPPFDLDRGAERPPRLRWVPRGSPPGSWDAHGALDTWTRGGERITLVRPDGSSRVLGRCSRWCEDLKWSAGIATSYEPQGRGAPTDLIKVYRRGRVQTLGIPERFGSLWTLDHTRNALFAVTEMPDGKRGLLYRHIARRPRDPRLP